MPLTLNVPLCHVMQYYSVLQQGILAYWQHQTVNAVTQAKEGQCAAHLVWDALQSSLRRSRRRRIKKLHYKMRAVSREVGEAASVIQQRDDVAAKRFHHRALAHRKI